MSEIVSILKAQSNKFVAIIGMLTAIWTIALLNRIGCKFLGGVPEGLNESVALYVWMTGGIISVVIEGFFYFLICVLKQVRIRDNSWWAVFKTIFLFLAMYVLGFAAYYFWNKIQDDNLNKNFYLFASACGAYAGSAIFAILRDCFVRRSDS